jgi:argininosuccinate synthase
LEKKAKASGASQLVVKDLREEFVRDYVRKYLLGTSMARPVIAKVSSYLEVCYIVGVFTYSKHVDFKEY